RVRQCAPPSVLSSTLNPAPTYTTSGLVGSTASALTAPRGSAALRHVAPPSSLRRTPAALTTYRTLELDRDESSAVTAPPYGPCEVQTARKTPRTSEEVISAPWPRSAAARR